MTRMGVVTAATVSAAVLVSATGALAGGHGCAAGAIECYRKVRTPDVVATVAHQVVVRPGYQQVVTTPAVIASRPTRVEVAPATLHREHVPAVYGAVVQRQLVSPASVEYVRSAPVCKTVHETVQVAPAGVRWEHRRGLFGREEMCKVPVAAVHQTVSRQVMVDPGAKVAVVKPAVYRDVTRPVLIAPAKVRTHYQPAKHHWVDQAYVVKPATQHVVTHPPVVATEHRQVVVQHGQTAWVPASRHH